MKNEFLYARQAFGLRFRFLFSDYTVICRRSSMACCCFEQLYEVVAVSSETGIPGVGDTYPLDSVYCRDVVKTGVTVAITEIDGLQGMSLHPLYDSIPCESYISSPIHVEGKVWGTLNFTSLEKRDMPFSEAEIKFNEENASLIARALNEDVARTEPVVS